MTAKRPAAAAGAAGGAAGRERGRGKGKGKGAKEVLNEKSKLKHPTPDLLRLITAYLYVPLSTAENVVDPVPPKKPTELLLGGMGEQEGEGKGKHEGEEELDRRTPEHARYRATLNYYGPLPCRRQRRDSWEAGAAPRPGRGYGRGMPGLARDVLRWLVALNLSFPIKNIKRDFSNGFMVAEIFSRYFPADIHMHSYDYGSRVASKRDNWEQLNKFFRKKGFVVQSHEIENIIYCKTEEGAGPLLGRMYNFLTQKMCKPEDRQSAELCKQQNDSFEQGWNPEAALEVPPSNCREDHDQYSRSESGTSSCNRGEYEEDTGYSRHRDAMSVEDFYHGAIKLDPMYESDSLFKMDDEEYIFDLTASPENAGRFALQAEEQRHKSGSLGLVSRYKGSSAIERARQREVKKVVDLAKAGARGEELRFAELARKARVEAGLAFRSPHRERTYKQYTLPDYRQQKQFGYVELGRLGPGDPTPELVGKVSIVFVLGNLLKPKTVIFFSKLTRRVGPQREKLAQRKEFGRHARSCNIMSHTNPTLVDYSKTVKTDAASSRKKALAFASKIPKPKLKIPTKDAQKNLLPIQNPHAMSDLQILEAKHQSDKLHIESIRRDLEHFLR